jgi:acyl-CoA thioesterase-1
MRLLVVTCLLATLSLPGTAAARQQAAKQKRRPARQSPLKQITDDPTLPRVLLIGDSISIGYTLPLRESLKGQANVHRPAANCGPTTRGLDQVDRWLGKKPWDVIHFNWGLHDLKYLGPDGKSLADPKSPGSRQQVPIDQYKKNLRRLVARLKKTGATLIWRSTTPVPEGAKGRVVGDAVKYNAVAASVMKENGIAVDDMYVFAKTRLKQIQRPANVHFTKDGSKALASHAAGIIHKSIDPRTGLRTTVRELIRLLQKKDYATAIKTMARPDELAQSLKQKSFEQLLERFSTRKAGPLLVILNSIKDTRPKLGPAGRLATFALPKPVGSQKSIVFQKVDRFWYIVN